MKVSANSGSFEPCPEFSGRGVCVDVTPLKKRQSQFGEREEFRIVFEVDLAREDGSPFCVWSRGFTPTLNEKSNLRKFLKSWFGRDLTETELLDFETETLLGRPAEIAVIQEHKDGQTFANIGLIRPHKNGQPLKPTGKFVRAKDRTEESGNGKAESGSSYRRAAEPPKRPGEEAAQHLLVRVHVGKCTGMELRDLSGEQLDALAEKWMPAAKAAARQSADDKRLIAALEWWLEKKAKESAPAGATEEQDDLQY